MTPVSVDPFAANYDALPLLKHSMRLRMSTLMTRRSTN